MNKVVLYVQCRTGSTRFPRKVLSKIGGQPYLELLIKRLYECRTVDEVVLITTSLSEDNEIEELAKAKKIRFFRGSPHDLLDRHYQANKKFKGDYVIKVPSDCPFADPKIIDEVVSTIKSSNTIDYASNYHPPTFPDGLDVEVTTAAILEYAWFNAKEPHEREHTFPYIWDNPEKFNLFNLVNKKGNMFSTHRWTVDYPKDLEFVKAIYSKFDFKANFYFDEILKVLEENSYIKKINSQYNGINWYRNVPGKLRTVDKSLIKGSNENEI